MASPEAKIFITFDDHIAAEQATEWYLNNCYHPEHHITFFHLNVVKSNDNEEHIKEAQIKVNNIETNIKKIVEKHNIKDNYEIKIQKAEYTLDKKDVFDKEKRVGGEIIVEIEKAGAEMVIMGCKFNMKSYLGSVSEYIVKNTHCVCLIKKYKEPESDEFDPRYAL